LFLTLTGLCLYSCHQEQKTVMLRLNYEPGMNYPYVITYKIIKRSFENDSIVADVSLKVIESGTSNVRRMVNDSTAEVAFLSDSRIRSLDKIKSVETDTTIVGYERVYHFSPTGNVVWFDIPSDTIKTRTAYLRQWLEQGMPVFPAQRVYEGYSWTQSYHVSVEEDDFETSTTYQIKSFVHDNGYDCAVIAYDGLAIINVDPCPSDSTYRRGLDRISTKGLMHFAYNVGMIVHQTETYVINGNREVKLDGETVTYKSTVEGNAELTLPGPDLL